VTLAAAVVIPTAGAIHPPALNDKISPDDIRANTSELYQQLKAIETAAAEVTDLRADFVQRRHTPLLRRPMVSRGSVIAVGDRIRWDTVSPTMSSMLVGPTSVELYYPTDALIEIYPIDQGFMDLVGVPMPKLSILKKRFDISRLAARDLDPAADPDRFLAVELTPRTETLREHVTSVKMLIDKRRSIATKVIMTGPDDDRTEISFSNIQLNTGIDVSRTDLNVPEGTRRVRPLGDATTHLPQEAVK
jgi:outer membrane lipoprotein-sorting protein